MIDKMINVMQLVEAEKKKTTVRELTVFLAIGQTPGVAQGDLGRHLGIPPAGVTRVLSGWRERPGSLGLIAAQQDPTNLRSNLLSLTPKGQQLFAQIKKVLGIAE